MSNTRGYRLGGAAIALTHTVIATGDDGQTAMRPYVPVETGLAIDVGILDLGMGARTRGHASAGRFLRFRR